MAAALYDAHMPKKKENQDSDIVFIFMPLQSLFFAHAAPIFICLNWYVFIDGTKNNVTGALTPSSWSSLLRINKKGLKDCELNSAKYLIRYLNVSEHQ